MTFIKTFFTLWVSLLLAGCVAKVPLKSEAWLIVLKTPKWRFADTGYIRSGDDVAELEVFETGQPVLKLRIEDDVCVRDEGCIFRHDFNVRYLSGYYPDDLMLDILLGRPIFGGAHLTRTPDGFEQRLSTPEYDIIYTVTAKVRRFKDATQGILIKLKRL